MDKLLQFAAVVGGLNNKDVELAACALLDLPDTLFAQTSSESELNWNGSPLQLLLSFRRNRIGVRLLSDPGFQLSDATARYSAGRSALSSSFAYAKAHSLLNSAERLIEQVVPSEPQALGRYAAGTMWLAMAIGDPGAALYVAPDPTADRWQKAKEWISNVTPAPREALMLIDALQNSCFLLGLGIEGACLESARIKIYWRMTAALPLSAFGIPLLNSPTMIEFLSLAIGKRDVAPNALNFAANFDLMCGALRDIKVDVSSHDRSQSDALELLSTQARIHAIASPELSAIMELIEQHGLEVGCIGLGLDTAGEHRINTYLYQPLN